MLWCYSCCFKGETISLGIIRNISRASTSGTIARAALEGVKFSVTYVDHKNFLFDEFIFFGGSIMILCNYNSLLISCHIDCWFDFTCFLIVSQSQLTISDVARKAFLHSVCGSSLGSGFIVFLLPVFF